MPTQSMPLACPACGHETIVQRYGQLPRCARCKREIPLASPAPTEADRLRAAAMEATEQPPPDADPETAFGPLQNSGLYRAGWRAAMRAVRAVLEEPT